MEGTPYTQKTMDLFLAARKKFDNVGIVLQAYLHRTYNDIQEVMKHGGRIRLCKGAYKETPTLAFQNMKEIRENYLKLAELLLNDPQYHAFATHDDYLIHATRQMAEQKKRAKDTFEYQMLYGLRKKSWFEAHDFGYHFRVYVPFGTTWFPYFSRRLRERKENVLFILRNLLRD